jgi:hypothetical protein
MARESAGERQRSCGGCDVGSHMSRRQEPPKTLEMGHYTAAALSIPQGPSRCANRRGAMPDTPIALPIRQLPSRSPDDLRRVTDASAYSSSSNTCTAVVPAVHQECANALRCRRVCWAVLLVPRESGAVTPFRMSAGVPRVVSCAKSRRDRLVSLSRAPLSAAALAWAKTGPLAYERGRDRERCGLAIRLIRPHDGLRRFEAGCCGQAGCGQTKGEQAYPPLTPVVRGTSCARLFPHPYSQKADTPIHAAMSDPLTVIAGRYIVSVGASRLGLSPLTQNSDMHTPH